MLSKNEKVKSKERIKVFSHIFDYLTDNIGIANNKKSKLLKEILLDKSENSFGPKFKVDFSFCEHRKNSLRFTYNSILEDNFSSKMYNVFSLFDDVFDLKMVSRIFELIKKCPLTLGIDWEDTMKTPKLKIEFEFEDKNVESNRKLLIKLFNIMGFDPGQTNPFLENIFNKNSCAVSLAFNPNKKPEFKAHFFMGQIEDLDDFRSIYDQDTLNYFKTKYSESILSPDQFFYLLSVRYNSDFDLSSVKVYRVYEMGDVDNDLRNISDRFKDYVLMAKENKQVIMNNLKIIQEINNSCIDNSKIVIFPSIIGIDKSVSGNKEDLSVYFSVK